jgi:hypothetical protein
MAVIQRVLFSAKPNPEPKTPLHCRSALRICCSRCTRSRAWRTRTYGSRWVTPFLAFFCNLAQLHVQVPSQANSPQAAVPASPHVIQQREMHMLLYRGDSGGASCSTAAGSMCKDSLSLGC